MALSKPMTRFAHIDGHTEVCYDDTGKYLLTCGADGDIRVWNGFDDDNTVSHRVGDCVYAIVFKGGRLYAAADNNVVQIYTFPDLSPDGIVTRCTSRISHLSLNAAGTHMAVGSSDFDILYVEIASNVQKLFAGHTAPVLSVAVDPKSEFLASSSCDGFVKIWHVATQKPVSNMKMLNVCSDVSLAESMCRMAWSPSGGVTLAVPAKGKVELYERNSWKKTGELTAEGVDKNFNVVSFSPNGHYICGATTDGWIVIWSSAAWTCLKKWRQPKSAAVTSMEWNPAGSGDELCFADSQGQLGFLQNLTHGLSPKAMGVPSQPIAASQQNMLLPKDAEPRADKVAGHMNDRNTDESSDDEDTEHIRKLRELVGLRPSAADGGSEDMNEEDATSGSVDVPLTNAGSYISAAAPAVSAKAAVGFIPTPVLQAAFKPGSTPVGLQSRFMVWNLVGIVRQYAGEGDEESTIDVEFHDSSIHHSLHLSNNCGYTMADLSTEALLLASEGDTEADGGSSIDSSQLFCMHFGTWDAAKEWAVTMPDREVIEALAVGQGFAAVATSRRLIRLFTTSGTQLASLCLSGRVVALAAHGNTLMASYHRAVGLPGDQCLGLDVMEVRGRSWQNLYSRDLPLSPKSTLSWMGLSDEGTPFAYDSAGTLRLLSKALCSAWVEVANLKQHAKGRSDSYWMVGVNEQSRQVRCVLCRGSSFPPTLPRPVISLLPLQMPFCEMQTEKGQIEEKAWQSHVLGGCMGGAAAGSLDLDQEKETCCREEQEALMKLFAMACRSERECRALQLCELMPTVHAMRLAAKYAARLRRADLVARINEVIAAREAANEDETQASAPAISYSYVEQRRSVTHETNVSDDEDHTRSLIVDSMNDSQRSHSSMMDDGVEEPKKPVGIVLTKRKDSSTSKSALSLSQGAYKNPFKLGPVDTPPGSSRGSRVFDTIEKPQPSSGKTAADSKSKASSAMQCRLFDKQKTDGGKVLDAPQKQPKSAFELWFAENEGAIRAETSDADAVLAAATETFQQLPRDEKKKWMARAKTQSSADEIKKRKTEDTENGICNDSEDSDAHRVKRVSPDGADLAMSGHRKLPLASGGNAQSKLAAFAFAKQTST